MNNLIIYDNFDDECETVQWIEPNLLDDNTYDCDCCSECMCDDDIECENCGCECCKSYDDDEFDITEIKNNSKLSNFNINIYKDTNNEKKVRLTLEVNLNYNKKNETININLDINSTLYLKIAEELFN